MKMKKEKITKGDGRFLIYYTFEEEKNKEKKEGENV